MTREMRTYTCSKLRRGLELTQRAAHIGQRVPVLTGRTILCRLRCLASVGDWIPELSVDAIERLCRTDPGA